MDIKYALRKKKQLKNKLCALYRLIIYPSGQANNLSLWTG
jgi:hypothetical protein